MSKKLKVEKPFQITANIDGTTEHLLLERGDEIEISHSEAIDLKESENNKRRKQISEEYQKENVLFRQFLDDLEFKIEERERKEQKRIKQHNQKVNQKNKITGLRENIERGFKL